MLFVIAMVFSFVLAALAAFVNAPDPWHNRLLCLAVSALALAFLFEKMPALLH